MSRVLSLPGKGAAAPEGPPAVNSVEEILAELRAGRMVVIVDDEDRENEGDLIIAAEHATPEAVAFMIRHTSGIICVPMEEQQLARLDLPQMVPVNSDQQRTAFTVSVDLRVGTTTGVSSADRAATIRGLADEASAASDFARPGHIFPLRDLIGVQGGLRAWTLRAALQRIVEAGHGVIVVLRQQDSARELTETLRSFAAAAAPDAARADKGEGAVLRTFGVGAQILKDLGVRRMRVLSAPKQMHGISAFGLEIEGYVGEEG